MSEEHLVYVEKAVRKYRTVRRLPGTPVDFLGCQALGSEPALEV
jgi:hypothetical protein